MPSIVELKKIPSEFSKPTLEPNLLTFQNHHILVAEENEKVLGSIRVALRVSDPKVGLITDLIVDPKLANQGLEDQLITQAEQRLRELGVAEVDGLARDGVSHVRYFYRLGYKPFRRTVFINWDLNESVDLETNKEFEIREFSNLEEDLVQIILNSLQPYWTTWKERADKETQKKRIEVRLVDLFVDKTYRVLVAYQADQAVGLVDVRVEEPNLVFGVCIKKDFGGRKLGSTLLSRAFDYLKKQDLNTSSTVATSGLDDYDPQIYLYTLSAGGKIEKEYIDLTKSLI